MSHTPKPWPEFNIFRGLLLLAGDEYAIISERDYNRARACVNACAGSTTDELNRIAEAGGWDEITAQWSHEIALAKGAVEFARKQRDDLLTYAKHRHSCAARIEDSYLACSCGLSELSAKIRSKA